MMLFDPGKHGPDLSAYLDGELDARRAEQIERLLSESPEARAYLDELRDVSNGLRALPKLSAPDALRAALRAREAGPNFSLRARAWMIPLRAGAIAAALGIAWIAGQSLIGPVTAPERVLARRNVPPAVARGEAHWADEKADEEPVVALGVPATTARELDTLRTATPTPESDWADADADSERSAPPFAVAPAPTASDARGAAEGAAGAGGGGVFAGAALSDSADELPQGEFDVVVNTSTAAEYKAVNDLLLRMQVQPVESRTAYVARVEEADGGEMHQLQLPASEMNALVAQLEDRSPQNVLVQRRGDPDGARYAALMAKDDRAAQAPASDTKDKAVAGRTGAPGAEREKKEPVPRQPAARKVAPGRDEEIAKEPSPPATPESSPADRTKQAELRAQSPARQRAADQVNRNAGRGDRGGRVVYRAPAQQRSGGQNRAAESAAASQTADTDDTLVVNVVVAPPGSQSPPAAQSQPASRPSP